MPNVWRFLKGSTQLEAFYERYQREGVPNDLSMQAFCSMHNVPYNCFERHDPFVTLSTTATPPATVRNP